MDQERWNGEDLAAFVLDHSEGLQSTVHCLPMDSVISPEIRHLSVPVNAELIGPLGLPGLASLALVSIRTMARTTLMALHVVVGKHSAMADGSTGNKEVGSLP